MTYQADLARVAVDIAKSRAIVGADLVKQMGLPAPGVTERNGLSAIETSIFSRPDLTYKPNSEGIYDALRFIETQEPTKLEGALRARGEYLSFLCNSALGINLQDDEAMATLKEVQTLERWYGHKAPSAVPKLERAVKTYLENGPLCVVDFGLVTPESFGEKIAYARRVGDQFGVSVESTIQSACSRRAA